MLSTLQLISLYTWRWFRKRSLFVQCLLLVPVVCAITFTLLIGNVGLAVMGSAVPLYGWMVGAIGGAITTVLAKAVSIIYRDKRRTD